VNFVESVGDPLRHLIATRGGHGEVRRLVLQHAVDAIGKLVELTGDIPDLCGLD
jgi:hypothetical protein